MTVWAVVVTMIGAPVFRQGQRPAARMAAAQAAQHQTEPVCAMAMFTEVRSTQLPAHANSVHLCIKDACTEPNHWIGKGCKHGWVGYKGLSLCSGRWTGVNLGAPVTLDPSILQLSCFSKLRRPTVPNARWYCAALLPQSPSWHFERILRRRSEALSPEP